MHANYLAILPEISLAVLAALLILIDLRLKAERKAILPGLTAAGLAAVLALTLVFARPGAAPESIWGGMLRHDMAAFIFRLIFLFGAAVTCLFSIGWKQVERRGEFFVLLVLSTLGMTLMAAAGDLIMLFLAIETASIPLYVMAGFMTADDKSTESGFKYLLFGALTSSVMVYGFSLLYGFAGTTNLYELAAAVSAGRLPPLGLVGALALVLAGFGFKVAVVPFHFWAPDVYEGAPTPVTAFLSTASKSAGFAVVARFLLAAFPADVMPQVVSVAAVLSLLSMTMGNSAALAQRNIKRLLAYSSIAHAGYILMGVAAASVLGAASVVYYLAVYLVTNLAAFGVVIIYFNVVGSDEIKDYAGLSRRHPGLAFALLVALLSLAGVPPLGGFFAKILVFAAAVQAGLIWLAVAGVLNAILGLYYYLMVLKVVYLDRGADEDRPLPVRRSHMAALVVCLLFVLALGTVFGPMYDWSNLAAGGWF